VTEEKTCSYSFHGQPVLTTSLKLITCFAQTDLLLKSNAVIFSDKFWSILRLNTSETLVCNKVDIRNISIGLRNYV
jgi:hypothetical protein